MDGYEESKKNLNVSCAANPSSSEMQNVASQNLALSNKTTKVLTKDPFVEVAITSLDGTHTVELYFRQNPNTGAVELQTNGQSAEKYGGPGIHRFQATDSGYSTYQWVD